MLNVVRAQSIHKVPILTAVLSIMCEANLVKREFHDAIAFMMKGELMSETWTHSFMNQASQQRPASNESMIPRALWSHVLRQPHHERRLPCDVGCWCHG